MASFNSCKSSINQTKNSTIITSSRSIIQQKPLLLCFLSTMLTVSTVNCASMHLTQRNNHANISELLDNLLRGYDNSIRPGFGGSPAIVEVDIMVRSMGPISEVDMTYSMDCYFRQSWVDRRLAFVGAQDTLALSISMLARIWKPDTYFYNGKQSYLHTITTPNKFVRLHQDGTVLYSSRLTIKAGCPMNLADFPMDVQRCPLKFGSFGYTTSDVIYKWNGARHAVTIAEDMKLSQFDLVDCPAGNVTDLIAHSTADQFAKTQLIYSSEYSMLLVSFHLQRHMGNFLIQVYGPCVLLVVLSWVSFWLNREATADRVSLGITTVLTMTFLGLEARTDLPKVPYPTALDFFVFLSFAFIFATIIQFAVVHYFTKYGSGECYFSRDLDSETDSDDDSGSSKRLLSPHRLSAASQRDMHPHNKHSLNGNTNNSDARIFEVIPLSSCSVAVTPMRTPHQSHSTWLEWPCRRKTSISSIPYGSDDENIKDEDKSATSHQHLHLNHHRLSFQQQQKKIRHTIRRNKRMPRFNSVSKIDRASRIFFPLVFFVINLFYWYSYLTKSERWTSLPVKHFRNLCIKL